MNSVPFFLTHHGPVGAWASLTFGVPGQGVSIDLESPGVEASADLIVAVSRGAGNTRYLPFAAGGIAGEGELVNAVGWRDRWQRIPAEDVTRRLSPCLDEFEAGDLGFRILTPHERLPDPEAGESLASALCPAILLEVTVDNRGSSSAATGFLGLDYLGRGRIAAWDDGGEPELSGIRFSESWALVAESGEGVFTVRDNQIAAAVEAGRKVVHNGGQEGGIAFLVAPGEVRTLTAVFAFYRGGPVTQGLSSTYWYTQEFAGLGAVCRHQLRRAGEIRTLCAELDEQIARTQPLREPYEVFCQAVRAYAANTQVLSRDGKAVYNVTEGRYLWRNTLDLAADHLPWELGRNPWVVRNIVDQYLSRYSYYDQIRFADEPGLVWPGGLSFAHDMGNFTAYSPPGCSGYEMADSPHYGFMTTEELLNGIYCLGGYVLATGDLSWALRRLPPARDLLESLENRDHHEPPLRDGLLKGESLRCGPHGREITTYDCLDSALLEAGGSPYLAVKTWSACLLLADFFDRVEGVSEARRCRSMAAKTAGSFASLLRSHGVPWAAAAFEPLAVPLFLGLGPQLNADPAWKAALSGYARSCLQPGRCLDATTGGLRLSAGSVNTWPSKALLCLFVWKDYLGFDLKNEYPSLWRELVGWTQHSASHTTLADQINAETREVIGALWYPRAITSAVWTLPPFAANPLKEN